MPIESIQIATNRYAPAGSEAILMYDTGASGALTLGQLVQAVCIRSAAAYEAQSVNKMNKMTAGSVKLDDAAAWLPKLVDGSADWAAAKAFLTGTMGISASALPASPSRTSFSFCSGGRGRFFRKPFASSPTMWSASAEEPPFPTV